METKKIQSKFSTIYKIVNFLYWLYIIFAIAVIIVGSFVAMTNNISLENLQQIIVDNFVPNALMYILIIAWVIFFFFCNLYVLNVLRTLAWNFKNWEIFTEANAEKIKLLFWIFGAYFLFTGLVLTGGMVLISGLLFVWVLYEIFFIGFDYKKQKDKLEEENNLTI